MFEIFKNCTQFFGIQDNQTSTSKKFNFSWCKLRRIQAGSSKADFVNKVRIALREMRESNYWLRIINEIKETDDNNNELLYLIKESEELKNILGAIIQKSRNK